MRQVFYRTAVFPGKKCLSAASFCCNSFAQHVQEEFPAPGPRRSAREPFRDSRSSEHQSSQLEITPCSSASTPLRLSCCHVPFGSSFHHPDISPFSFLWNFLYFSLVRSGFEGLGTAPVARTRDRHCLAPVLHPFLRAFSCAQGSGKVCPGIPGPQENSPQHQPSAFQCEEQTRWRCLHARRVLIPHRGWQGASSPLKLI